MQPITQKGVLVTGIGRAAKPQEVSLFASALALHMGKRARKGKPLTAKLKAHTLAPLV